METKPNSPSNKAQKKNKKKREQWQTKEEESKTTKQSLNVYHCHRTRSLLFHFISISPFIGSGFHHFSQKVLLSRLLSSLLLPSPISLSPTRFDSIRFDSIRFDSIVSDLYLCDCVLSCLQEIIRCSSSDMWLTSSWGWIEL
jgi:hypothetical protein